MSKLTLEEQFLKAPQVATRAHEHQLRKDGTPYVAHAVRVAQRALIAQGALTPDCMRIMIASFLHDTVEDTDMTLDDLREMGFDELIVAAVDRVSKRPGEKYMDFIARIKGDGLTAISLLAIQVKLADIEDNLEDQSALDPEEADFLKKRYTKAAEFLRS